MAIEKLINVFEEYRDKYPETNYYISGVLSLYMQGLISNTIPAYLELYTTNSIELDEEMGIQYIGKKKPKSVYERYINIINSAYPENSTKTVPVNSYTGQLPKDIDELKEEKGNIKVEPITNYEFYFKDVYIMLKVDPDIKVHNILYSGLPYTVVDKNIIINSIFEDVLKGVNFEEGVNILQELKDKNIINLSIV